MGNRAGLVQKKVNVRTKSGKMAQRSMWVRAGGAIKKVGRHMTNFDKKHPGVIRAGITAATVLGGTAYLMRKHGISAGDMGRVVKHKAAMALSHPMEWHMRAQAAVAGAKDRARRAMHIPKMEVRDGKLHVHHDNPRPGHSGRADGR